MLAIRANWSLLASILAGLVGSLSCPGFWAIVANIVVNMDVVLYTSTASGPNFGLP